MPKSYLKKYPHMEARCGFWKRGLTNDRGHGKWSFFSKQRNSNNITNTNIFWEPTDYQQSSMKYDRKKAEKDILYYKPTARRNSDCYRENKKKSWICVDRTGLIVWKSKQFQMEDTLPVFQLAQH